MVTAERLALCKVLLIFDGLDESRLLLDFQNNEVVSDVTQTSSVNVLLTNLIKGNLLSSALLWITYRPAAASQIPSSYADRITEVRGFTETQKEEYFSRRFNDEAMSCRIISHVKSSRSLYIMCHIPVFCWITATVLEHMSTTNKEELPKTLTEMYSHFLLVQAKRKIHKYAKGHEMIQQELTDSEVLLKLGRLAFEHLEKGNIMFYQEDLERCGLDVREALVFSGLCTEIFKRECVLHQKIIYCFVHLSIQEFLAAVYMVHCYMNKNTDVLATFLERDWEGDISDSGLDNFLSKVVDKSLNSGNGHLGLFVRFLHGLLLESNHCLLGVCWAGKQAVQKASKDKTTWRIWMLMISLPTEASTSSTVWWRWMIKQFIRRSKSTCNLKTDLTRNSPRHIAQLLPTCYKCLKRFLMCWTWRSTTHQVMEEGDCSQLWETAEMLGKSRC